jgi:hypothetical protein
MSTGSATLNFKQQPFPVELLGSTNNGAPSSSAAEGVP